MNNLLNYEKRFLQEISKKINNIYEIPNHVKNIGERNYLINLLKNKPKELSFITIKNTTLPIKVIRISENVSMNGNNKYFYDSIKDHMYFKLTEAIMDKIKIEEIEEENHNRLELKLYCAFEE